jgi:uncharacterized membrane protein
MAHVEPVEQPEPRWQALVAVIAVCGIYLALPAWLVPGPRWLLPAAVGVLLVPTLITHRQRRYELNHFFGIVLVGVITLAIVASVVLLVTALPTHKEQARDLLRSAASLWISNILVFASWYWRLDAGGPHRRDAVVGHSNGSFLFPQMTLSPEMKALTAQEAWSPGFVDYLFLAFNTSTALSPTDTAVLSRWAKALMMVQALISLAIITLLAARAVNIF